MNDDSDYTNHNEEHNHIAETLELMAEIQSLSANRAIKQAEVTFALIEEVKDHKKNLELLTYVFVALSICVAYMSWMLF